MNKQLLGMGMAALAAIFWGAMGSAGQYLLQKCGFVPLDLISIRMLLAGSLFVGLELFLNKSKVFAPFRSVSSFVQLLIYTATIIGTQLTYFMCIQYSNAAVAGVLTATVPLWVMLFMVVFQHQRLSLKEILCGAAAVIGVFLIVTGGSLRSLNVSVMGLIMGLGSGLTGALYVILPQKLIKQVGSGTATSWALLLTGVAVTIFNHFWNESLNWSLGAVLAYAFIVTFGTIAAFWLFQAAAELIPSDVAGMMETLDPVSATVLGVLFLGLTVNAWELIGGVLILATVVVLAIPSKHPGLYKHKRGNGS